MAVIVRDKMDGSKYILLGTGFGAFQSVKPNWLFGDLVGDKEDGQIAMVCVCDSKGHIGWFEYSELTVESIDGRTIEEIYKSDG